MIITAINQDGGQGHRLHGLVSDGQLRVGEWQPGDVRPLPRRFQRPEPTANTKSFGKLLRQGHSQQRIPGAHIGT